jgi:pyruvate formate lyase activating enzyme
MLISGLQKLTLLDYPGKVACTVFTGGCNFRCPFCHNSALVLPEKLAQDSSPEEVLRFLRKRVGVLDGVAVTGGEPLLHPDMGDFLREVKALGFLVKLDTNGTNAEMVDELMCEGLLDYIAIDIKAGPAGYSRLTGVDFTDEMYDSLLRCRNFLVGKYKEIPDLPYEFRTTVVGGLHTEADFEELAEFVSGAKNYYLRCFQESENVLCRDRGFYSPSLEEMLRYKAIVEPYVENVSLRGIDGPGV